MGFKYTIHPSDGEVFAPGAFDNQIGRRTNVRVGDRVHEAIVLDAKVADDGRSVDVTVDADLSAILPTATAIEPGDFSIAEVSRG